MRVGIDATAVPLQRAGAGNYIFNLIQALARVDRSNEYVVFGKAAHEEELDLRGSTVHFVQKEFSGRGARLLWEQVGLPKEVRTHRLDVLHSPHYTMPLRHSARSVVTFCDMTFVLHPDLHEPLKRVFFPVMMRLSARRADRLIAISESTREDLVRMWGVDRRRVTAIPLAADSDYHPLPPKEIAETCTTFGLRPGGYILYVGMLEPRKNVDRLVEAFGRVAGDMPDLELVIGGRRGWMYDQIFAQVEALGLHDRVRFTGFVPQEALPALYGGARFFVYPSKYEGFGIPVLEAMSCGTPVITTNVSSMPEVAGDAAILVAPDDVAGLASALVRAAADHTLRADLACKGLMRAKMFSWERCARETIAVYEAALTGWEP
ncbi:MAG TPA: glycosyltransferase family 1 protein [Gemmatimonadales bacterium]|jgi:glycosyltransferase involved in cell wall biosynthesis